MTERATEARQRDGVGAPRCAGAGGERANSGDANWWGHAGHVGHVPYDQASLPYDLPSPGRTYPFTFTLTATYVQRTILVSLLAALQALEKRQHCLDTILRAAKRRATSVDTRTTDALCMCSTRQALLLVLLASCAGEPLADAAWPRCSLFCAFHAQLPA